MAQSDTLKTLPVAAFDFIFGAPEVRTRVVDGLEANRDEILESPGRPRLRPWGWL
jgi:hypothetical protein